MTLVDGTTPLGKWFRMLMTASRRLIGRSGVGHLPVITVAIFVIMSLISPNLFFTWGNFSSMAFQFPEFAILALAMMMTMLTGGIDLSIVALANLSAIFAAFILQRLGTQSDIPVLLPILLAVAVSIATGLVGGAINGVLIAMVGMPPILATLGTSLVFSGIALALTGGAAVLGFPDAFSVIGNGDLWNLPIPVLIFAVFAGTAELFLRRTGFGVKLYLLGTNPLASRFAGLNTIRLTIGTYLISGALAAVSGIIMMSRANSAKADYGESYLLLSILIAVLGGTNPDGGSGRVGGLVLAVLSLQFLSSGFNILEFSNFGKDLMWGALLLLVMVLNRSARSRSGAVR